MSTTLRPMRDDPKGTRCSNAPPPKEKSLKREGSTILDIEALIWEAYENLKVKVNVEKKLKMESKPRRMVIEGDKR